MDEVMIMATRFPQLFSEDAGQAEDDLTLIQGIGPAVAERLHSAGIWRYAQLARQTPEGLATHFTDMIGFTPARIQRQDWIGQALTLMPEEASEPAGSLPIEKSQTRQHYAVFTVELLLDEELNVRRTRALHVQTQQDRTWSSWAGPALLDFIQEMAGLDGQGQRTAPLPEGTAAEPEPPPAEKKREAASVSHAPVLGGNFSVQEMHMVARGETQPIWTASAGQPFNIRLGLDLSQVKSQNGQALQYQATVYGKKVGQADKLVLGKSQGVLALTGHYMFDVRCQVMEKGRYRMEVLVALQPQADSPQPADQIMTLSEGKLLTVN
jgi:hypothetical protein